MPASVVRQTLGAPLYGCCGPVPSFAAIAAPIIIAMSGPMAPNWYGQTISWPGRLARSNGTVVRCHENPPHPLSVCFGSILPL